MTRYKLFTSNRWKLYLHVFHRSDEDRELHDHPWPFLSLILWGGYTETRPVGANRAILRGLGGADGGFRAFWMATEQRRYWPGALLFRPPWWAHRVELAPGKKSVSLVLVGPKRRDWGFFSRYGWVPWKLFTSSKDCG